MSLEAYKMMPSCSKDPLSPDGYLDAKIAVVLPMSDGRDRNWRRTVDLCCENISKATGYVGPGISRL